jgi:hypothetical protein
VTAPQRVRSSSDGTAVGLNDCDYSQVSWGDVTVYSLGGGDDAGMEITAEGVPEDGGRSEEDPMHRG